VSPQTPDPPEGQGPRSAAHPTPAALALAWARVGTQSFGGGAVSLELIRREVVDNNWVTEAEFARTWALCQATPGVNQLALAVVLGNRVAGPFGILASLAGFLLPSAALTVLIAWGYESIAGNDATRSALKIVIPAATGVGLSTALRVALPIAKDTPPKAIPVAAILAALVLAAAIAKLPVFAVLLSSGLAGTALFLTLRRQP
jgi:chromate transporter